MRVYGIVGRKNSGKTHLVSRLVAEATRRGLVVSTIKHAHHGFDIDQPGKDSHLHREAGAHEVLVSSPLRYALMHELRGAAEPTLEELLARLSPCDLVLVEGYKRDAHPKLEVRRRGTTEPPLYEEDVAVEAVATDGATAGTRGRPALPLDDTGAVLDFILGRLGIVAPR